MENMNNCKAIPTEFRGYTFPTKKDARMAAYLVYSGVIKFDYNPTGIGLKHLGKYYMPTFLFKNAITPFGVLPNLYMRVLSFDTSKHDEKEESFKRRTRDSVKRIFEITKEPLMYFATFPLKIGYVKSWLDEVRAYGMFIFMSNGKPCCLFPTYSVQRPGVLELIYQWDFNEQDETTAQAIERSYTEFNSATAVDESQTFSFASDVPSAPSQYMPPWASQSQQKVEYFDFSSRQQDKSSRTESPSWKSPDYEKEGDDEVPF